MDPAQATELLGKAHQHWRAGQHDSAATLLKTITHSLPAWPPAIHLAGLVARSQGDLSRAEDLMRRSLQLPGVSGRVRAEYASNLGHLLAFAGHPWAAEAAFRTALEAHELPEARLGLANVMLTSDRAEEAVELLDTRALQHPKAVLTLAEALARAGRREAGIHLLRPHAAAGSAEAVVALGRALRGVGQLEEAATLLEPLCVGAQRVPASLALAEVRLAEGNWQAADSALRRGLDGEPLNPDLLARRASLAWMMGDSQGYADSLRQAVAARPDEVALRLALYSALDQAGAEEEAERVLREGLQRDPGCYRYAARLASRYAQTGRIAEGRGLISDALTRAPSTDLVREQAAVVALIDGDTRAALEHTAWLLARYPLGQYALALRTLAWRLAGDPSWIDVAAPAVVCRQTRLEPPRGYRSIEEYNQRLAEVLRARHTLSAHPLMNSVRGGTQIEIDPHAERDAVLQAFFGMIRTAVQAFLESMPTHTAHPLFGRRAPDFRLSGCWTVRLRGGSGRHVSHIHPRGWLSSAYYVSLPGEMAQGSGKPGWLSFGKPPYPIPGLDALGWVKPEPGVLALFPSYQWHSVEPYGGHGERLTLAFDVVPSKN